MAFGSYAVIWIGFLILFGFWFLLHEPKHSRLKKKGIVENMLILLGSNKIILSALAWIASVCLLYLPAGDCANQRMFHALKCSFRIIGLVSE